LCPCSTASAASGRAFVREGRGRVGRAAAEPLGDVDLGLSPFTVEVWRSLPEDFCRQVEVVNGQVSSCDKPSRAHQAAASRIAAMPASLVKVVVEVVSPGSRKADKLDKMAEYADAGTRSRSGELIPGWLRSAA
jgi:hypothetical protein